MEKKVFLIHQNEIQHYRCSIYNYLSDYLLKRKYSLKVISAGVQSGCPYEISFSHIQIRMSFFKLASLLAYSITASTLASTFTSFVLLVIGLFIACNDLNIQHRRGRSALYSQG